MNLPIKGRSTQSVGGGFKDLSMLLLDTIQLVLALSLRQVLDSPQLTGMHALDRITLEVLPSAATHGHLHCDLVLVPDNLSVQQVGMARPR